ncbi:MAG TPA: ATP-binding protein, partial [Anaerolineales bacterium]|nr:ATP-binding protein [Anaerolineales bacterium]
PTTGAVEAWSRQLDQEARLLPAREDAGASSAAGSGLRQELWVVVPESASRVSLASERRFSWEALARLLGVATSPADKEKAASSSPQVQLSLPLAPRCEATAITMLEQIAERQGLAAEATDALRLALTEACRNAVQHSHNPGGKLLIDYCISSSKATLSIFNEGVSFGSQQEEALPEAARGTGLKLIRSLMDEVSFQAEPNGTRLSITKKFQPEATVP